LATQAEADRTIATLRGAPADYPYYDGVLRVRVDRALYHGYSITTGGLHPSRGEGGAAGGIALIDEGAGGLVMLFGEDRGPAAGAFMRAGVAVDVVECADGARVVVAVEDGKGRVATILDAKPDADTTLEGLLGVDPFAAPGGRHWLDGLRRVEVRTEACRTRELWLTYSRMDRSGLLSPFGIKSAHPLDGKHPSPGAPTQFWSGTVWAPHSLHGCYALDRYGYHDLAAACARAFCDATATSFAAGGEAFEHLSHENGHGLGVADYTWTAAVALVLMDDFVDPD
jgi:hypothetical protein